MLLIVRVISWKQLIFFCIWLPYYLRKKTFSLLMLLCTSTMKDDIIWHSLQQLGIVFLTSNRIVWAIVRANWFTDNIYAWLRLNKRYATPPPTTWGRHRWFDNQTRQGWWYAGRNHTRHIWDQTIYNYDFDKGFKFTILALYGPSPLTRLKLAEPCRVFLWWAKT